MYYERTPPDKPPCNTCRVDPLEENEDALQIFFMSRYQFIMGPTGPIALNQLAVHENMRLCRIKNRIDCFNKVMHLGNWWIDYIKPEDECR